MRMPRHTLKLIALAAVFSVAPAIAGQAGTTKSATRHCCPKKHAKPAAAVSGQAQHAKGATTITLPDRVPDGSILDLGWRHGIFTP
jgi:hypothetical protein